MAVANYHSAHGHYPPAYVTGSDPSCGPVGAAERKQRPWHSWRVLILPYIEQQELYAEYDFQEPWDGPNNRRLAGRMPKQYRFHTGTDGQPAEVTNYLAVTGTGTVWPGSATVSEADVTDAKSATILLVENRGAGVNWMEPRDLPLSALDFRLDSPNGLGSPYDAPAVVTLDDGVHRLHRGITPATLRALFTINGGERLSLGGDGGWELLADGRDRPIKGP